MGRGEHGRHGKLPGVLPYLFCSPALKSEILKSEIGCPPSVSPRPSAVSPTPPVRRHLSDATCPTQPVRRNRANGNGSRFDPSLRWHAGKNGEPVADSTRSDFLVVHVLLRQFTDSRKQPSITVFIDVNVLRAKNQKDSNVRLPICSLTHAGGFDQLFRQGPGGCQTDGKV